MNDEIERAMEHTRQAHNELLQNSPEYRAKIVESAREAESINRYRNLPMTKEMEQFNQAAGKKIPPGYRGR